MKKSRAKKRGISTCTDIEYCVELKWATETLSLCFEYGIAEFRLRLSQPVFAGGFSVAIGNTSIFCQKPDKWSTWFCENEFLRSLHTNYITIKQL